MSLLVNINLLAKDTLALKGELAVVDLDLGVNDQLVQANTPLKYDLTVEKLEDAVLAQGQLTLALDCQCVRCLKPMVFQLDLDGWACHLPLEGEDAVPVVGDSIDLTPHIREDILLGFPQYPVCQPECGGLKGLSPVKSKQASDAATGLPSSALSELDKLKL
jgi:uncharacterized protein